jgi:zinc transporter ZupT
LRRRNPFGLRQRVYFALALFVGLPVVVHVVAAGIAVVLPFVTVGAVLFALWVLVFGRRR